MKNWKAALISRQESEVGADSDFEFEPTQRMVTEPEGRHNWTCKRNLMSDGYPEATQYENDVQGFNKKKQKVGQALEIPAATCTMSNVNEAEACVPDLTGEILSHMDFPWKSKFDDSDSEAESDDVSVKISAEDLEDDSLDELLESIEFEYRGNFLPSFGSCQDISEYECLHLVGSGSFGKVYQAQYKATGKLVALKHLIIRDDEEVTIGTLREVKILRKCHHPNVVGFRGVVTNSDASKIYIAMEYLETTLQALVAKQHLTIGQIKTTMLHLLRGIQHLHVNHILHRDLKPSNLLISSSGMLKIADLGLSREFSTPANSYHPYTPVVVTLWYRAPELLLGIKEYGTPIDLWSVGCIAGEVLNRGKPIFRGTSEINQLSCIFQTLGSPNKLIWPGVEELPALKRCNLKKYEYNLLKKKCPAALSEEGFTLLNRLLTYDPCKRYSAAQALASQWFTEIPDCENIGSHLWKPILWLHSDVVVESHCLHTDCSSQASLKYS